ncbi:MAG TPA: sulfatase, partial [Acidimicrobiia bacterium]|nr:sulfatase [Acidimicrobiia bacterium]
TEFDTPNLDRFARRSVRFTQHYSGALPCMPARHDLLVGALDFLWRPWGSIELWEDAITVGLRSAGVVTKLVTDHPHLFETGGENYHVDFTAWDYQRGHEGDLWRTRPDTSWAGAPAFGRGHTPYDNSRGWFRAEHDFPGPRVMREAVRWLKEEAAAHDRFLLFVDEFDPHEPFDTPEPYASMYDPSWREAQHLIWPPYTVGAVQKGVLSEREARQVRAQYGGKLTMIDTWFGRLLDALEPALEQTAVIVCTDHGHFLGEKDIFGKPGCPIYEPLGHTPLLIAWPGIAGGTTCDALTTNVDLHATLCDVFDVVPAHPTHGRSLLPMLRGDATSVRDWALSGVWGREVHLIADRAQGTSKYVRAPDGPNEPLSMWSNRWSTMPLHSHPDLRLPRPDDRAVLDRMPGSTVPVIRQPFTAADFLPFWAYSEFVGTLAFDLGEDPNEERNLADDKLGRELSDMLYAALRDVEAPPDQFVRLGYT